MKIDFPNFTRVKQFIVILACVAFAYPLVGYALNGSYIRFTGDDYCDAARFVDHGFMGAFRYYYLNEGGRFSAVLLGEVLSIFHPKITGVLPGLAIVVWLGGLALTLRMSTKLTNFSLSRLESLLGAEFLVFMTLYQTPNLPQDLFWRTGMLAYLIPVVLTSCLAGFVFQSILKERFSPYTLVPIAVLAFIFGGFSESAVALNVGFWGLFFITSWAMMMKKKIYALRGMWLSGSALVGSLIAMMFIFFAPGNGARQLHDQFSRTVNLFTLTRISLGNTWNFIHGSFLGLQSSSLVTFAYPFLMAVFLAPRQSKKIWKLTRQNIIEFIWIPVAGYLLITCSVAPSVFAYTRSPELRVLLLARFIMVITLMGLGWLVGYAMISFLQSKNLGGEVYRIYPLVMGILILMVAVTSLYPVYASQKIFAQTPTYRKWGAFWDARDQEIRLDKQKGIRDLEVVKIDHIIPWVGELSRDPSYWYNQCAARYYQVDTIRANKPGWDH